MKVWNISTGTSGEGSGAVTIVEGTSFAISAGDGSMLPDHPHGVFYDDIRIVSKWEFSVDNQALEPLTVIVHDQPYQAVFLARARRGGRTSNTIFVERERRVGTGMREDITLRNMGREPAACTVTLVVDADFADLFEVKKGEPQNDGHYVFRSEGTRIIVERWWRGMQRGVIIQADDATSVAHDRITFRAVVPERGQWSTTVLVRPVVDGEDLRPRFPKEQPVDESEPARRLREWQSNTPVVSTDNDALLAVLRRSQQDVGALRIFDSRHPQRSIVAAGAPWFMALFGRDSLLTAYMALPLDPSLALGTLQTLADRQGVEENILTEEEPGRILHEIRLGRRRPSGWATAPSTTAPPMRPRCSSSSSVNSPGGAQTQPRSKNCSPTPTAPWNGSNAMATATGTGSWNTGGAPTGVGQPGVERLVGRYQLR